MAAGGWVVRLYAEGRMGDERWSVGASLGLVELVMNSSYLGRVLWLLKAHFRVLGGVRVFLKPMSNFANVLWEFLIPKA